MKSLLKKIAARFGYSISGKPKFQGLRVNVFKTSHTKHALLSYIANVFDDQKNWQERLHTNKFTTYLIAEVLNELEYNVDVIDCREDFKGDFSKYDLVIGLGKALEYIVEARGTASKTKVILFGTGCGSFFANKISIERLSEFSKKHHRVLYSSSRHERNDGCLQIAFSDWIILHGGQFAKATYRSENISTIHAPVFIEHEITRTEQEWPLAKLNYLWLGSGGAIHKGLDLVIDAFLELKNCQLHICGSFEKESGFKEYYSPLTNAAGNITWHGFIGVQTPAFKKMMQTCAFVIFPSASEGNSPSVITCMANGGLIPIVSKNADIDLNGFGIFIKELNVDAVIQAVKESQKLTIGELKVQRAKILEETHRMHTFDYFKVDFKQKLQEAIRVI